MFPFTTEAYDTGHYVSQPWNLTATFLKYKPKDISWYAYDVELSSLTRAKFTVYDIADFCSGGIGAVEATFECDIDAADGERLVKRHARKQAKQMEEDEFQMKRAIRRAEIEAELLESVGITA